MLVGILADSHGYTDRLKRSIEALKDRGADRLIHLGDMIDTLRLETVDECVGLLIRSNIAGVMGNHEYSLVMHHFKRYPDRFSETTRKYVRSLPYSLEISDACFTHCSPDGGVHGLFASTDAENYKTALRNSDWPVIVNGHSHEPRIYRQLDGAIESIEFELARPLKLERSARYILTCGALEDWYCALFDLVVCTFEVISLRRRNDSNL